MESLHADLKVASQGSGAYLILNGLDLTPFLLSVRLHIEPAMIPELELRLSVNTVNCTLPAECGVEKLEGVPEDEQ